MEDKMKLYKKPDVHILDIGVDVACGIIGESIQGEWLIDETPENEKAGYKT